MPSRWSNGFGTGRSLRSPGHRTSPPSKHERRAPQCDSDPCSLEDFFDEYEDLCTQYELLEAAMVASLARYDFNSNARAMQQLAKHSAIASSWNVYRRVTIEHTPGAGEER
ncbi:hypothetical protein NMY22_g1770 [Coprinellus aureogranulatus]|nr:hypothetical protein NMY22_g1770 [Coprinellus aureogranulatus]